MNLPKIIMGRVGSNSSNRNYCGTIVRGWKGYCVSIFNVCGEIADTERLRTGECEYSLIVYELCDGSLFFGTKVDGYLGKRTK